MRDFIKGMNKQKIRTICIYVAIFGLVFIGGMVLFGAHFVKDTFGNVPFSQILFHLQFPLLGGDTPFVGKFVNKVIIPSFLCAFCITFPQFVLKIIIATIGFLFQKATFGKVASAFVLFALCLNVTNNKLKITHYLKTQETYSNLYETHYKPFDSANLADFTPKQNLIIILAESMESTFSSKNIPAQNTGGGGKSA